MPREGSFLGVGWGFPPAFTDGGAGVEMVSGADDIRQSLQILLTTAPGERVMAEAFGCDLGSLVFAELDQALATSIERLVRKAILDHEPRIRVDGVTVTRGDEDPYGLLIEIQYTVRATNSRFNMVLPFYRMEATRPGG